MKNWRMTNLNATWIDHAYAYKNAYDMVPHTWILHYFKIFNVADDIRNVIEKTIKNWKLV